MRRLLVPVLLAAAAASWLAPTGAAGDGAGTIRFVTPRRFATSVGPSTATLDVSAPAGATIVSVAFSADGVAVGTAHAPPWTFSWEAGDGTSEHKLDAIAKFSDGTEARASVTSGRRIAIDHDVATPVKVYAVARGAKGAYVDDLAPAELRVFENGRPQVVEIVSTERQPLRIAIVLDASSSMEGEKLNAEVASAVAFLDVLQPDDEALVVSYADQVSVLQEPTSDRRKLEAAIRSVAAKGGSALYDAIYGASQRLAALKGRRVLVLLADGRDEAAVGRKRGSVHTLEEAQDRALRSDLTVFVIGLGTYLAHDAKALAENPAARALEVDLDSRRPLAPMLASLAATAGGSALFTPRSEQLRQSFESVAEDLRHQCQLVYDSDDTKKDGAWREIKVVADRPDVVLTYRKGYFGPSAP
jgi:Ca-activated chloride channel family protein